MLNTREGKNTTWGDLKNSQKGKDLLTQLQSVQRIPICQTSPKDVAGLSPLDRFLYWICQRHEIWLKKELGFKKPWTTDPVFQSFFFTSCYRENDKTTVWFRNNIRDPLRDKPEVLFATVAFRWFNLPATGEILLKNNLLEDWNYGKAVRILNEVKGRKKQIFTGAYMVPAVPGSSKVEHVCKCLNPIWRARRNTVAHIKLKKTLEECHSLLSEFSYLGGFSAYEVVTDLRHTYLLENAPDIMTWCNPGPGCARGLKRLAGEDLHGLPAARGCKAPKDYLEQMQRLLKLANRKLRKMPRFEMREIEHSLCEFDKYERARLNDGHMKRGYKGV